MRYQTKFKFSSLRTLDLDFLFVERAYFYSFSRETTNENSLFGIMGAFNATAIILIQ